MRDNLQQLLGFLSAGRQEGVSSLGDSSALLLDRAKKDSRTL